MGRCFDTKYLKSGTAAVKFIELLALLGSVVTVFTFVLELEVSGTVYSRSQFFLLVTMTALVIEFVIFIVILTRMTKNLPVPWPWVNIIFGILFAIFTFLATGLLASSVAAMWLSTKKWPNANREWETISYCQYLSRTQNKTSCMAIQGGTAFGFLSGVLFLVDIYVNAKAIRNQTYLKEPTMQQQQHLHQQQQKDNVTATTSIK